nr:hypothetical protein [Tanacetum cinerariifolium]
MVRDSIQLETAVNTISHEYLLEFTSEYGISEMLHPELPRLGDMIVDFPEGKGIDANAPPKSLRMDHADLRPSGVPTDISDPDPLAFANAPSSPPADVA